MTRRCALIGAMLLGAGDSMRASQFSAARVWKLEPTKLIFMFGGDQGFSALEVRGPDGETITLTPEQIMAALRED